MYFHYCNKPLVIDKNFKKYSYSKINNKPEGIWLSIDHEWKDWCISENYNLEQLYTENEIKILDMSKIFVSNTIDHINKFIDKYGIKYDDILNEIYFIDWDRVKKDYDGIIVNNFYEIKYKYMYYTCDKFLWLYGWDIPSGCIWNPSILEVVNSKNIQKEIEYNIYK